MLDGAGVGSSNPEAIFLLVLSREEGNPYTITPYSLLRTSKSLNPFFCQRMHCGTKPFKGSKDPEAEPPCSPRATGVHRYNRTCYFPLYM